MSRETLILLAADAILALHIAFVAFVVFGLVLIYAGWFAGWRWVRNLTFRRLHLLAIGVVVAQSWLGVICPLTTLEMWLRRQVGDSVYSGTFVSHWMQNLLYVDAPAWVFVVCYTLFGALVITSWYLVRPSIHRP